MQERSKEHITTAAIKRTIGQKCMDARPRNRTRTHRNKLPPKSPAIVASDHEDSSSEEDNHCTSVPCNAKGYPTEAQKQPRKEFCTT